MKDGTAGSDGRAIQAELAKAAAKSGAIIFKRADRIRKKWGFGLETLVIDPEGEGLLNVEGEMALAKWTEQVKLYDDDNSYTVKWGGEGKRRRF